jgi:hypothetical protein
MEKELSAKLHKNFMKVPTCGLRASKINPLAASLTPGEVRKFENIIDY